MLRRVTWTVLIVAAIGTAASADVLALRYPRVAPTTGPAGTVSVTELARHLDFLLAEGYEPVRLRELAAVEQGTATLPERALLLTFDGTHASTVELVLPVLEAYRIPAAVAVTTGWLDGVSRPPDGRELLTWDDVRRLAASPLVEVASATHELHRMVPASPFGDLAPAATTRMWSREAGYETEQDLRERVRRDLERSQRRLVEELGAPAPAVVWPFGAWDRIGQRVATEVGLGLSLVLDGFAAVPSGLPVVPLIDAGGAGRLGSLVWRIHAAAPAAQLVRFVTVEPQWLLHTPEGTGAAVARLVAEIDRLGVNGVLAPLVAAAPGPAGEAPGEVEALSHLFHALGEAPQVTHRMVLLHSPTTGVDPVEAATWVARLVPASAVVLDDRMASIREVVRSVTELRPAALIGATGRPPERTGMRPDLLLVDVGRGHAPPPPTGLEPGGPAVAVRLTAPVPTDAVDLAARLLELSAAGYRWLGLAAAASREVLSAQPAAARGELSLRRAPGH